VLGYLQLLKLAPEPLSDTQRGFVDIAEGNARRLQHLVGDLLATAQAGAGAFTLQTARVELNDVVAQSVASALPAAEAAEVTLTTELAASVIIDGDADRLGQATDNLISNALKFTPAGGTVTVTTAVQGTDAVLTVRDTGVGIPSAEVAHLSERFFRASTARAIPGVGLGLTVVRQIATAHGGRLDVDSAEGRGTTFSIVLPIGSVGP
jgi:signal transduction histidine kinase